MRSFHISVAVRTWYGAALLTAHQLGDLTVLLQDADEDVAHLPRHVPTEPRRRGDREFRSPLKAIRNGRGLATRGF